jgi:hypothetical protein
MHIRVLLVWIAVMISAPLLADEPTRCVQEELRKRNLYFGDIDGRMSVELSGAIKRYQTRKNLDVTGEVDEQTAHSLNVALASKQREAPQRWPDVPVLKSDAARELSEPQRRALEKQNEAEAEAAPAESPHPSQNLTPERVTKFVERYLRDGETGDIDLQVGYYDFPVKYFDHGAVNRDFVWRDTRNYVKRWPTRHYQLIGPVSFAAGAKEDETQVQFSIAFTVKNARAGVTGQTRNFWTIRPVAGEKFKIIAIREQRSRE